MPRMLILGVMVACLGALALAASAKAAPVSMQLTNGELNLGQAFRSVGILPAPASVAANPLGTPPTSVTPLPDLWEARLQTDPAQGACLVGLPAPCGPNPPSATVSGDNTGGTITIPQDEFRFPIMTVPNPSGPTPGPAIVPITLAATGNVTGSFDSGTGALSLSGPIEVRVLTGLATNPLGSYCALPLVGLTLSTTGNADFLGVPFTSGIDGNGALTGTFNITNDATSVGSADCVATNSVSKGLGSIWLSNGIEEPTEPPEPAGPPICPKKETGVPPNCVPVMENPDPAGETANAQVSITPRGPIFFSETSSAANWELEAVIVPPEPLPPTITPMKVADIGNPPSSMMTFNPSPSMPVCRNAKLGPPPTNVSIPVPDMLARCPDSLIGNGTGVLALFQSTSPAQTHPVEMLVFNGGLVGGLPKIKVYGYNYATAVGAYIPATLQPDGRLKFDIPYMTADSSLRTINLSIPGEEVVLQKTTPTNLTVTLPAGQDPDYVQAKCVRDTGFPWTADFILGSRDLSGNPVVSPAEFLVSRSGAYPCTTPPDTIIIDGPTGTTNDNTPTFSFAGDPTGETAKVQCKIDDADFADCTDPHTFTALTDGSHTAAFRAQDAAGNQDPTPATRTFTVDTTPPDTTIIDGPSGTITTNQATFTFAGNPSGDTAKVQCRIDNEPFADCTSSHTFTALTDGSHTAAFRAQDAAGNQDQTPATRNFTVDTTPPSIEINSGPSGVSSSAVAALAFSANEAAVAFECQLDGSGFTPCTSPQSYGSLAAGAHTFEVRGTDPAGNVGPVATRTWTFNPASTTSTTSGTVPAGGVVTTDPTNSGPTVQQPVTAAVSLPNGGTVEIVQGPSGGQAPTGFSVLGQQFSITAPDATVSDPLVLSFRLDSSALDSSALPAGVDIGNLTLLRNGVAAANCTSNDGTAVPDPCVASREQLPDGDVVLTILSSRASDWIVAYKVADEANISKVKVNGPAKVKKVKKGKKGKKATYKVAITNSGNAEATGVRLKVSGRGVSSNTSVGKISATTTRTVKVKLKPKKTGKAKLTFKVTSGNAGGKTVRKTITVR